LHVSLQVHEPKEMQYVVTCTKPCDNQCLYHSHYFYEVLLT